MDYRKICIAQYIKRLFYSMKRQNLLPNQYYKTGQYKYFFVIAYILYIVL